MRKAQDVLEILFEVDGCIKCQNCTSVCPVLRVLGFSAFPGPKHLSAEITRLPPNEIEVAQDVAYLCSTCAHCKVVCPTNVPTPTAVELLREYTSRTGVPKNLMAIKENLEANQNVFDIPNRERADWTAELSRPPRVRKRAKTLYFVGCLASFHPRSIDIALDTIRILDEIGADYTIMGTDEWCCGAPYLLMGQPNLAKRMAEHNVEIMKKLGVDEVIASCAGCYRVITQEYPILLGGELDFNVLHTSEYFAGMIDRGKIVFKTKIPLTVTYHDPCELGRRSGIYEPPRRILENIPGIKFIEIREHGFTANCCGGGGAFKATYPSPATKIGENRLKEVRNIGADLVASCCPACKWNLSDAAVGLSDNIKVLDLSEIIAKAMF